MNNKFCALPFVHSCVNVGGRNKPCCRFRDNSYYDYADPKDYFKSDKLNDLRKKMIAGEFISGCQQCYDEEEELEKIKTVRKSYRQLANARYSVDVDNPRLQYIEIGLSNSCNFACVTCNAAYSTTWWKDIDAVNALGAAKEKPHTKVVYTNDTFTKEDLKDIVNVKLLGGEPLMEPKNLNFLKKLVLPNVSLSLVTNGSVAPNEEWQKVLNELRYLTLSISIDGVGETAEFVRYGTNWEKIEKNVEWWINHSKEYDMNMNFQFVVHTLNIHNIPEFEKWNRFIFRNIDGWQRPTLKYYHHPAKILNTYTILSHPKYLDIKILPRKEKEKHLEMLDDYYSLNNEMIANYLRTYIDYEDEAQYSIMTSYYDWLKKNR